MPSSCFARFSFIFQQGSHGASKHVQIIAFPTGHQAITYLRHDCQCASIVGLMGPLPGGYDEAGAIVLPFTDESSTGVTMMRGKNVDRIDDTLNDHTQRRSYPVHAFSFTPGNICFVISKSRSGLPSSLFELCESYVHIAHSTFCAGDDWLLDTPSCLSILLHMYTNWANYDERTFQGHKFEVARRHPDEITIDEDKQQHRASARIARLEKVETVVNATALGTFFGDESNSDY
jgi:hypothetical protein